MINSYDLFVISLSGFRSKIYPILRALTPKSCNAESSFGDVERFVLPRNLDACGLVSSAEFLEEAICLSLVRRLGGRLVTR